MKFTCSGRYQILSLLVSVRNTDFYFESSYDKPMWQSAK